MRLRATLLAGLLLALMLGAAPGAEAKNGDRPNLVLILTDDQTFESVSRMPYLDGRDDWIRFDQAVLNNPLCCPARATILSGKYSHHTRVENNGQGRKLAERKTIAPWLRRGGYRTGFIGKYLNAYPWRKPDTYVPRGWDRWFAFLEPLNYYDYRANSNGQLRSFGSAPADYLTDVINQRGVEFVSRRSPRPFFLFLSHFAPHGPATAPDRHAGLFDNAPVQPRPSFNEADVSDKPAWVQALGEQDLASVVSQQRAEWRALQAVDEGVRDLFGALRARKALRDTVVVFLSDNGVTRGEHRTIEKPCAYEECVRTPLLVRYPGQPGRSEGALASNVDLAPTLARIARVPIRSRIDGRSLKPVLMNRRERLRGAQLLRGAGAGPSASPAFWGVRGERYKYVELETGESELYDLAADPYELENLAGTPGAAALQRELAGKLERLRSQPARKPRR